MPYDYQNWGDEDYGDKDGTAVTLSVNETVDTVQLTLSIEHTGVEAHVTFSLEPDEDLDDFIRKVVTLRNLTRRNRDVMYVQVNQKKS